MNFDTCPFSSSGCNFFVSIPLGKPWLSDLPGNKSYFEKMSSKGMKYTNFTLVLKNIIGCKKAFHLQILSLICDFDLNYHNIFRH